MKLNWRKVSMSCWRTSKLVPSRIAPERKIADGVKYVLTPFRKAQLKVVDEVLDRAAEAVRLILDEGPAAAMNRFNRKAQD